MSALHRVTDLIRTAWESGNVFNISNLFVMASWETLGEEVSFSLMHRNKVDQDKLEALHSKVVERLEGEVAILQAEVDNARLVEAALQEKVERQAELLSQWKERDNSNSTFSGLESEVGALQSAVAALEKDKDTLTLKVSELVMSEAVNLSVSLRFGEC